MFGQMNRLSVRNRIWGIVLIFIGSIVLVGAIDMFMLKKALHQEKEAAIRQVVDSSYSVLAHYESLQQQGKLSHEEAQAAALSTIKNMRYNQNDYFWITDNQKPAHMVMHPIIPALDGQTLVDEKYNYVTSLRSGSEGPFTPTDGRKNLTEAFIDAVAKTGDGYVTYHWPKVGHDGKGTKESFPKLSYIKAFTPWGWIIGSGIYIDDIDAAVTARSIQNLLILLGTSAVLLLLTSLIAHSITRPLGTTMQAMQDIARGNTGLDQRLQIDGRSEISQLASNFNQMLDHIQARDQALRRHQEILEDEIASRTASLRETNLKLDAELNERKLAEEALQRNFDYVKSLNRQLEDAQNQLLQSEKMASIGQLAAGVAHEINNPIGFVSSNLGVLKGYVNELLGIIDIYHLADALLAGHPEINLVITRLKEKADLEFVRDDIQVLLRESHEGVDRVAKIVRNLRDFSRIDSDDWGLLNLEQALDNTVNIIANEIRQKADLVREYGNTPAIECLGAQLNQVFMNLLLNAAQAIELHGTITLRTGTTDSAVWAEIADTGRGIAPENLKRIFEPFFTTRAIGQGTGLGLSVAYSIVQKHHGKLEVVSEIGRGSCFRIEIPRFQATQTAITNTAA